MSAPPVNEQGGQGTSDHRERRADALVRAFATLVVRRRRWVMGAWAAVLLLSALALPGFSGTLSVPPFFLPGTESARAARALQRAFPELGSEQTVLVFHSSGPAAPAVDGPLYRKTVDEVSAALAARPGVSGVVDLPVPGNTAVHSAYRLVGATGTVQERQSHVQDWQLTAERAAGRVSGGRIRADLLGTTSAVQDMQTAVMPTVRLADALALLAAFLALFAVLRRPLPAVLPLVVAGAAVAVALALVDGAARGGHVDLLTMATTSALGLGAGLDYALLLLMRCRERLAAGADGPGAAVAGVVTAGKTVGYSALTLMTGAASLLAVGMPIVRTCALGAITVTATALLAAVTLLPACLAQWPQYVRATAPARPRSGQLGWQQWALRLMRHPWRAICAVVALLALAALPAGGLHTGFDFDRASLTGTPSGTALHVLERDGLDGAAATLMVVLPHPGTEPPAGLGRLMAALETDPGVAASATVDNQRGTTLVMVLPRTPLDSAPTAELLHRIRHRILPAVLPPGRTAPVGGVPGALADQRADVDGSLMTVGGCLLAGAFLFLLVAFRSLLLPLKAVVVNVAVAAATFGILAVCAPWLGTGGRPVINHFVPLITVVMLFGLSLDYEMFLVRRMREQFLATGDNTRAVAEGLARTAVPISLAAVIMVAAFASFLVVGSAQVRQFGFAVAVAVALDATLVRLVLMPALMQVLGRWNWWLPGWPSRSTERGGSTAGSPGLPRSRTG
ncbi:MMPL family transporter [Streptomyces morookaense]|uniref:MMPL family transporter n=1 Tax=Streptomyces morookaense TaxID=1970 RepID=UPI0033DBC770